MLFQCAVKYSSTLMFPLWKNFEKINHELLYIYCLAQCTKCTFKIRLFRTKPAPFNIKNYLNCVYTVGRVVQSGWTVRDRIPVGTRFFARPDRPWGPPSLVYNGYRVFPGGKVRPGRTADHSPPSSAAVMEEQSYTSTHPLGHTGPETGSLYLLTVFVPPTVTTDISLPQLTNRRYYCMEESSS